MITVSIQKCPLCNSGDSIMSDFQLGQVACANCGAVLDDRVIDETAEWRNLGGENGGTDKARVGVPVGPYEDDLSTVIQVKNRSGPLSGRRNKVLGGSGKSHYRVFKKIDELAGKLDLPLSIINLSKDMIIDVEKEKKLKGRNLDCIIAAIFFQACRKCNAPRTLKELVQSLQLDKKDVSRCFNSIKMIIADPSDVNRISINTQGLVNNYCNHLGIANIIRKAAMTIADEVCKKEIIAGRNPSTVATASIYFALQLYDSKITKKEIAEKCRTNENTINSAFQQLALNKSDITPVNLQALLDKITSSETEN